MGDTVLQLGAILISGIWSYFSINVPGFTFTFGQMYFGIAICGISILILKFLMGVGGSASSRTGTSHNPKISKERQGDQH